MRIIGGAFSLFLLFFLTTSFATPPTSITLTYNMDASSLHVEAIHPTFDVVRSYVRLMVISVNGTQEKTINYHQQNSPDKFWDDVPLVAKVGDVIKVDLYCTLGGSLSQEMTVTKQDVNVLTVAFVPSSSAASNRTLIRNITIEGFLLEDRKQFVNLFKHYRNQWLSEDDINGILEKINKIYEQEGFQKLVSISYKVDKHQLIFTVSMTP